VTAVVVGIVWGTMLAMMRLSSNKPLAGSRRVCDPVPLDPAGDGAAVVLPDRAAAAADVQPVAASDLRMTSAMIAFSLFEAAYYSEIIRAGIQSVRAGRCSPRRRWA
jgi:glutamate/aspartate transport system permease protein